MELNEFKVKTTSGKFPRFKVVPIRCGSKSCKYCLGLEVRKIRRKLFKIPRIKNMKFFTLTTKNDDKTEREKLILLVKSFRKLTLKLRKDFPDLKYFYIIERGKNGMWHIHGLWNIFIEVKTLSTLWMQCSGAYRVWLSRVQSEKGIVKYISAYLTKSGINHEEKKVFYESRKRQFNSSRGFFEKDNYKSCYDLYSSENYSVEELKKEVFIIIDKSKLYRDEIIFTNYNFANELLDNIYYSIYCEPDQQEIEFTL